MPELKFAQPARQNLLAPVLIAFLVLGLAIALLIRFTPHRIADMEITQVSVYPAHLVFKSETMIVGSGRTEDDLYVLATLRMADRLHLPLFIKDFTATLTTADGQQFNTSAAEKQDIESIYASFPAMRPLASEPLLRETLINPGNSAEGMVLLHFPVALDAWEHRKSASLSVDLYHQGPITITIPPGTGTIATPPAGSDPNNDQQ